MRAAELHLEPLLLVAAITIMLGVLSVLPVPATDVMEASPCSMARVTTIHSWEEETEKDGSDTLISLLSSHPPNDEPDKDFDPDDDKRRPMTLLSAAPGSIIAAVKIGQATRSAEFGISAAQSEESKAVAPKPRFRDVTLTYRTR